MNEREYWERIQVRSDPKHGIWLTKVGVNGGKNHDFPGAGADYMTIKQTKFLVAELKLHMKELRYRKKAAKREAKAAKKKAAA